MEEYTYDIAFSFLYEDQALVSQVNALLKDRFKTFVYFKSLAELVDGEGKLSSIFEKEARIVVVFYRSSWGESGLTTIGKTAVKKSGLSRAGQL